MPRRPNNKYANANANNTRNRKWKLTVIGDEHFRGK
jgi:hypothetical protein